MSPAVRVWIPVMVFAIAFGGVLAYRTATPNHKVSTVRATGDWNAVLPDRVARTMNANAAVYHERFVRTVAVRKSGIGARRWLGALATGKATDGTARPLPAATVKAAAASQTRPAARMADLTLWAHALPKDRVQVAVLGTTLLGKDPATSPVQVRARLTVLVRQSQTRFHRFVVPVTLRMLPSANAGTNPRAARWRVADVRANGAGIRTIERPVLVAREHVDVLAPTDHRLAAISYAVQAESSLRVLRPRYVRIDGAETAGIYLVKDSAAAKLLLGNGDRDAVGDPTGWTYGNGDVVLLTGKLDGIDTRQALGTVRHEFTHVVMLSAFDKVPTLLLEGAATFEETRFVTATSKLRIDLEPLLTAFRAGTVGYQALLTSTGAFGAGTGTTTTVSDKQVELDYLAGYATIAYLEEHSGHDRVVELLDRIRHGAKVGAALTSVMATTPDDLQQDVRVWTKVQVRAAGGDRDESAAAGDSSGDDGSVTRH